MQINTNFDNIAQSYLFSTVAKKQREFQAAHPDTRWQVCLEHAEKLGLGSREYDLITI